MSDDTLLIILGNQLFDKKYLSKAKTKNIFMAEDFGLCTEEKYHKQKIFFFLSAMRTFKDEISDLGYDNFPVCMAKTQYSFSTDPSNKCAPEGHNIQIREIRLSAGAEFIVAIAGDIMTMPGLPKKPAAYEVCIGDDGNIKGLF